MSIRPQSNPEVVINAQSMASSITSKASIISKLSMVNYAVTWSGTSPVGVVTIQASNDYSLNADGTVNNVGTWNTLPLSATCNVSGNTGSGMVDIDQLAAHAVRLVYTAGSGVGTMTAIYTAKVA